MLNDKRKRKYSLGVFFYIYMPSFLLKDHQQQQISFLFTLESICFRMENGNLNNEKPLRLSMLSRALTYFFIFHLKIFIHTHTHTHTHIYIYVCVCVCVCV